LESLNTGGGEGDDDDDDESFNEEGGNADLAAFNVELGFAALMPVVLFPAACAVVVVDEGAA